MKKLLLIVGLVLILGGGAYWYFTHQDSTSLSSQLQQTQPPYALPTLTQDYTNSAYKFALKMPADFTASDIPSGDPTQPGDTILLQDKNGNGIQIVISPFDEDTTGSYTLTQARILQDVPDMQITEAQPLVVGPNYTGLAFKSDNAAFGGASREVWFVFRGNLYQISTYDRLDNLLKSIFQTWQFQ